MSVAASEKELTRFFTRYRRSQTAATTLLIGLRFRRERATYEEEEKG
jgi:hypothetical protein